MFCGEVSLAQPVPQDFVYEITSEMLTWKYSSRSNFPAKKSKAYINWEKNFLVGENIYFSELDINADGKYELIVADSSFPTCGRAFMLLKRKNRDWIELATFQGGFVLTRQDSRRYFNIQVLDKCLGEMYFYELFFREGRYQKLFSTKLARSIYDNRLYDKWRELNWVGIQK
jgi:hypothetical protein